MNFLRHKFTPHFVSFITGTVLAGIAGHFGGVSAVAVTAYIVGAYGSRHVIKLVSDKLK